MEIRKLTPYVLQGLVVGLVGGFLFLSLLKPDAPATRPVVTIKEAETPTRSEAAVGAPVSYASAVKAAAPAVVNVFTTKIVARQPHPIFDDPLLRRFFGEQAGPRQRMENSLGSGVIVSEQGFILTNNHVIAGADEILVALQDGRTVPAQVVGSDPETDVAVLKIAEMNLNAIVLGQSDALQVGDVVLAIGNPFGVGQTVTIGIVSATGRSQLGISTFENFIQTDAAINPGNSGGALVDPEGHLVGINTAIFSRTGGSQGIGFAIPVSLAKTVMAQIIEYGRPIRGWLGVEVQDITPELAESFGMAKPRGVLVAGVLQGGPADAAGLQPGDVVTHVDGNEVSTRMALIAAITAIPPQQAVDLTAMRNGKEMTIRATVGERPQPRSE
jgi:serine protease DegS